MSQQRPSRSWGTRFDSLTSSDSLSSNPESVVASSHRVSSPPRSISADDGNGIHDAHERVLQDASIFIGSLPANIEHAELTGMLSQHLSEHPQVKGIKVVRDSKGGTCAFIQCHDAGAASTLMHKLHVSPPQPFLGRYLRYEPARAFRTLLISYRSPRQYVRHRNLSRNGNFQSTEDLRLVDLQLPDAMRIIRTPGNKHLTVLFNADALAIPPAGSGTDPGLLFVPLLYDTETLFRIASTFGAVDYFGPYAHVDAHGQVSANFPAPHDGPRRTGMDTGCWRVKWAHRDDCVSALITLRKIPHLTVTWAHQSSTTPRDRGYYHNPRVFPVSQSWRSRGTGPALRSASSFLPASRTFPVFRAAGDAPDVEHSSDAKIASSNSGCDSWQQDTSTVLNDGNMFLPRPPRARALSLTHDRPQSTVSLPSRESTGQLSFTNWESANRTRWTDHVGSTELKDNPSVPGSNLTSSPYFGHHVSPSDSVCHVSKDSQEGDVGIPHTPDFGASPITPRTPVSLMLRTPATASYAGDFQSMSFKDYDSQGSLPQLLHDKRDDHIVDPTTIFVGGLEMYGPNVWDEGRVRGLFSKYGGIEAVKVIRPSNKRSAFAFVRFNNTDAPLSAIKGEHNRMLDGRLIRVQLRDWNPTYRPSWRPGHNKESDLQPLCDSDDFSVDPRLPKPGVVNIAAQVANLRLTDSPIPLAPPSSGEACDLNEVQDEAGIQPPEVSSVDNPSCGSVKEASRTEKSADVKQGESAPPDTGLASSQTSAAPAPVLPAYPTPTIQYYPGWIPSYAPQFPYQMSFAGQPYPGYPFPPPPPSQSGGSDGGATPSNTPVPFGPSGGAYPAFVPYPPPPNHGSDSGQVAAGHPGTANNPTLLHTQAPLIPTGFIQGDQGMLVPVYPTEALNQYMAGNQDQAQAPTSSGSAGGQPPVSWHPYPPPPIRSPAVLLHSYINPPLMTPPPPHLGVQAWIQGHPWHGITPQLGNPSGMTGRRISSPPCGGPVSISTGSGFERNSVPPRRQYRRDSHPQHYKNSFARGVAGRFNKAPLDAPRSPSDIQPAPVPQTTIPDASIDVNWQR